LGAVGALASETKELEGATRRAIDSEGVLAFESCRVTSWALAAVSRLELPLRSEGDWAGILELFPVHGSGLTELESKPEAEKTIGVARVRELKPWFVPASPCGVAVVG